jgi:uncharacterized protein
MSVPMAKNSIGSVLLLCAAILASARSASAQQTPPPAPDANTGVNLAIVAKASTSYVSGDQTITTINSGSNPRNSRDASRGAYGNWPHVGAEWVQYDWPQAINTNRIAVYWFADGQGIKLPGASRLLYWNGKDWVAVPNADGLGVAGNQYNLTTFPSITTSKLRLEFDSLARAVNFSTGILQWKVFDAGGSPDFPPLVRAGPERTVILGGKTFLTPTVRDIKGQDVPVAWSKASGPGDITFDDAHAAATGASFSQPGDYELALTAGAAGLSASDNLSVHVEPPAPATHMEPVYTRSYKINSAFWNARIKNTIVNWIPHCYTELSDLHLREGGIANFIEAGKKLAGLPAARHVGYPFANAYVHNTVEAMCVALMVDPRGDADMITAQNNMRAKLNEWIPIILSAQEPDGYLQTRFTLDPRNPEHWGVRTRTEHEGYTAGYFIESAIAHYLATDGKDLRLYNAAKKLADCWYDNIGPPPKKAWYDQHEEMEQALVRLGRFVNQVEGPGKGDKYIQLAKFLLDNRRNGATYDQTYRPVIQQYEAVGHAVRAEYLYSAMTDMVMETGDRDYQSAVRSIWSDLVNRKLYLTGGVGSGDTSEGFGPDYSLRNNSYCESCSGCGELFFQYKMNLTYQDARYADLYEDTLYNAILGDLDLDGKNFTYTNPLDTGPRGADRYLWHDCPCCVGNIPRTLLQLPTWMYTRNSDSLNVNLFVGSTVTIPNVGGGDVQMVQATDYPWSNKDTITVNPAAAGYFTIRVRVPDRQVSALYTATPDSNGITSISVNGTAITPTIENGYAVLSRIWSPGDRIDLVLPMQVQRIHADDRVAADRGRVALRYGPLIYNIEAVDQPNLDLPLKPDAPLTAQWQPDLLGGVIAIKGAFADGSPFTAIPNYARCNRGGRSLVWIKE